MNNRRLLFWLGFAAAALIVVVGVLIAAHVVWEKTMHGTW